LFQHASLKKEVVTFKSENGQKSTAEITLHNFSSNNPIKYDFVWGSDPAFKYPERVITSLKITNGDKKIPVPLSLYCDLTDCEKF